MEGGYNELGKEGPSSGLATPTRGCTVTLAGYKRDVGPHWLLSPEAFANCTIVHSNPTYNFTHLETTGQDDPFAAEDPLI